MIFVTIGIYYQFKCKRNWGENKNDYEWPGKEDPAQCLRVSKSSESSQTTELVLWKACPQPPRSICTLLLTWATVVGVSVHAFQEGHSRQGWLPAAAFWGHQTTAYRAGKEGGRNEQFQWLASPLLLTNGWQEWSCVNPSRRMVSHLPLKTHTKPWYISESSREALRNHFIYVKGLNLARHAHSPLPCLGPWTSSRAKLIPGSLRKAHLTSAQNSLLCGSYCLFFRNQFTF